jgi:hypothetical protein
MDKKTALELYTLFRQENAAWLSAHREHAQQYFTLVVAIFAASIAAISAFPKLEPLPITAIVMGLLFNVLLCRIAMTMCNRSYQEYLEGISIQAKLEAIIGLTGPRTPSTTAELLSQYSKDEYYLPERWLKSRHFATAEKFVADGMQKGSNRIIQQTFVVLGSINFVVAIAIAVETFKLWSSA